LSAEQLAKVYEQQEQAKYYRHRKVYTEVQIAKQQGSVGQPSIEAYLENPSQRLADPFPNYSSIHPDHMNNEVPSYCGFHASGKWIVGIIQVHNFQCNNLCYETLLHAGASLIVC